MYASELRKGKPVSSAMLLSISATLVPAPNGPNEAVNVLSPVLPGQHHGRSKGDSVVIWILELLGKRGRRTCRKESAVKKYGPERRLGRQVGVVVHVHGTFIEGKGGFVGDGKKKKKHLATCRHVPRFCGINRGVEGASYSETPTRVTLVASDLEARFELDKVCAYRKMGIC